MSQTSYSQDPNEAVLGGLYDLGANDKISRVAEVASLVGHVVTAGTDLETQARPPVLTTEISNVKLIQGIVIRSLDRVDAGEATDTIAVKEEMSILKAGRIWVKVDQTVVPTDTPFVRFAGGALGVFRKDADTANAVAMPGNAKFVKGAAAGGLALLEFSLR